jgi:hypothetical protein
MNYHALSVNGLLMLHGAIRNALSVDDNTPHGNPKPYQVRSTQDWRTQSDALEEALNAKGAKFSPIAWS